MTERDWEAASRARLEKLVADTVSCIRNSADEIEREARRNIEGASVEYRALEFRTYPRVAGQVVQSIQTLVFNVNFQSLIEAAGDAETARNDKGKES